MGKSLIVIDGNSLIFRAFHALPVMNMRDGTQINAVYGFFSMILNLLDQYAPTYLAVAFDLKEPTFRKTMFAEYKANREKTPDELLVQFSLIKKALRNLHIPILELEGYEADDIIGTITTRAEQEQIDSYILTGDRDSLQLISKHTYVLLTKKGVSETEFFDISHLYEVYGIEPLQIIDMKGLMGDASDNIPGISGVGEKTALKLLKQYASVEGLYEHIGELPKNKLLEKIEAGQESAFLSKKLATIDRNIPLSLDIQNLRFSGLNHEELYDVLSFFGFFSIIKRRDLKKNINDKITEIPLVTIHDIERLKEETEKLGTLAICKLENQLYFSAKRGEEYKLNMDGTLFEEGISFELAFNLLKPVLESDKNRLILHDAKDFMHFCRRYGIILPSALFDTMLAEYVLDPTQRNFSLDKLKEHYETVGCASALFTISEKQRKAIAEHDLDRVLYEIEFPLCQVLFHMEAQGFKVDVDLLKVFSEDYKRKIEMLTEEIYILAGTSDFNISSTKQLGMILFENLGLPIIKKTKTGYSTDAEVLEKLTGRHPIIEKLMEYRLFTKIKSTYIDGLQNLADPFTHKVHTTFSQTATATGRISSIEPNLQNIPVRSEFTSQIRASFIPSEEKHLIVSADYSQIELRILAHISHDAHMCDAFRKGEDIHARTASEVFGVPIEQVTSEMRSSSKAVNFGIVYGISDFGLAKNLGIPRYRAEEYINRYLDEFSGVRKYMKEVVENAKRDGYVKTLCGRIRYINELSSSNFNTRSFGERAALNTPIQGTAADIIKIAMINVFQKFKQLNLSSRLISQVHDELIVDAAMDEVEMVKEILKDTMENVLALDVPLKVNIAVGKTWAEAK